MATQKQTQVNAELEASAEAEAEIQPVDPNATHTLTEGEYQALLDDLADLRQKTGHPKA